MAGSLNDPEIRQVQVRTKKESHPETQEPNHLKPLCAQAAGYKTGRVWSSKSFFIAVYH